MAAVWERWSQEAAGLFLRVLPNACLRACLPFSSLVLHNINRGIFETIVEQAPLAIEDLMNEMEEEEDEDEEEGKMSDDDGQDQGVPPKKLFEKPPEGEAYSVLSTTGLPPLRTCPGPIWSHFCLFLQSLFLA